MEVKHLAFTATLLISVAPAASARDPGWYLGVSLGHSNYSSVVDDATNDAFGECEGCTAVSTTATGWSLLGGYRFNRYFALEAQDFDMGKADASGVFSYVSISSSYQTHLTTQFKLTGYGIDAVGSYPVIDKVAVFANLGLVSTRLDATTTGYTSTNIFSGQLISNFPVDNRSARKTTYELGVGGEFELSQHWSLRLGYARIHDVGGSASDVGAPLGIPDLSHDTGRGNVNFVYLMALLYF